MSKTIEVPGADPEMFDDLKENFPAETAMPSAVAIASIALNMALKYHDITTVQDGTLYQQFKLEGKNFTALHMDEVFHTAVQIENHLMGASARLANCVQDMLGNALAEMVGEEIIEDGPKKRKKSLPPPKEDETP